MKGAVVPAETIARALDVVEADKEHARISHQYWRIKELGDDMLTGVYKTGVELAAVRLDQALDLFLPTQPDPEALLTQDGQVVRAYLVARSG